MTKPEIKMGSVVALHDGTKDLAKVTNGTDEGGVFVPTEGVVFRIATLSDGTLGIAYAYRKLPSVDLLTLSSAPWELPSPLVASGKTTLPVHFLGRI